MISYLQGKVILKKEKFAVLDVNGVGYKVFLSQRTLSKIPEIGQTLKVFCHLDVKENGLNLYGFIDEEELDFFGILNDIRGIGPKAAIEISALGSLEKIKERVLAQDESIFSGIPGIGKKKAMTIILELTGKIKSVLPPKKSPVADEVEEGLVNLGFPRQEIKKAIAKIPENIKSSDERIKFALKLLGK